MDPIELAHILNPMEDLVFQVCQAICLFESCKKIMKHFGLNPRTSCEPPSSKSFSIFSYQSHLHLDVCQKGNLFICFQHPKFDTVTK